MTAGEIRKLQRGLNVFTTKHVAGFPPLLVDGRMGRSTRKRIQWVKFFLGYAGPARVQNAKPDLKFRSRLWHPNSIRYSSPLRIRRGQKRRAEQRREWKRNRRSSAGASGVGVFDGVPVALWLIPYLQWARANGWRGRLVSGWRDPKYSEGLCYRMCGRPSCPGRCAGRNSNHAGSRRPKGAGDVSDYTRFGAVIRRCPYSPRIFNALGARDPVHFSASGN